MRGPKWSCCVIACVLWWKETNVFKKDPSCGRDQLLKKGHFPQTCHHYIINCCLVALGVFSALISQTRKYFLTITVTPWYCHTDCWAQTLWCLLVWPTPRSFLKKQHCPHTKYIYEYQKSQIKWTWLIGDLQFYNDFFKDMGVMKADYWVQQWAKIQLKAGSGQIAITGLVLVASG